MTLLGHGSIARITT